MSEVSFTDPDNVLVACLHKVELFVGERKALQTAPASEF